MTALTRNAAAAIVLREAGIDTVVASLASHTWHGEIDAAPELALNCVSSGGGGTELFTRFNGATGAYDPEQAGGSGGPDQPIDHLGIHKRHAGHVEDRDPHALLAHTCQ